MVWAASHPPVLVCFLNCVLSKLPSFYFSFRFLFRCWTKSPQPSGRSKNSTCARTLSKLSKNTEMKCRVAIKCRPLTPTKFINPGSFSKRPLFPRLLSFQIFVEPAHLLLRRMKRRKLSARIGEILEIPTLGIHNFFMICVLAVKSCEPILSINQATNLPTHSSDPSTLCCLLESRKWTNTACFEIQAIRLHSEWTDNRIPASIQFGGLQVCFELSRICNCRNCFSFPCERRQQADSIFIETRNKRNYTSSAVSIFSAFGTTKATVNTCTYTHPAVFGSTIPLVLLRNSDSNREISLAPQTQ